MSVLNSALDCSRRGWPVFPCDVDKSPLTPNGFYDATMCERAIRVWWHTWPDALVGIACGPAGLVVLDLDDPATEAIIKEKWSGWTETRRVRTPTGCLHFYYVRPDGIEIKGSTKKLPDVPGADIKTTGGYVIAGGHAVYEKEGRQVEGDYTVEDGRDPAPLPPELQAMIIKAQQPRQALAPARRWAGRDDELTDVDRAVVLDELARSYAAKEGERHPHAQSLARTLAGHGFSEREIIGAVETVFSSGSRPNPGEVSGIVSYALDHPDRGIKLSTPWKAIHADRRKRKISDVKAMLSRRQGQSS